MTLLADARAASSVGDDVIDAGRPTVASVGDDVIMRAVCSTGAEAIVGSTAIIAASAAPTCGAAAAIVAVETM